ncbi:endonuclease G [Parabacteroides sp. PFB2-10]|uniref:DNA/RNA non-specific endonuclease n=1 Tax=Parabacteroides sp. PFB2-10 TaxID=1742405 RepID=UPI002474B479|nr:DNA/RNA non-specific endonuclease [Parabacteroides sp. PFB2-10]MDH6312172.1 endonuclease G [Parabacteroides sp. PFB2-10]MDL2245461.1 DNA/RNA non-specific endonuclease [Parabacteroides sp. OttesenSCG-928-J18]
MVQKKGKKKSVRKRKTAKTNRKAKGDGFLLSTKRFVVRVLLVTVGIFVGLYLLDYLYPKEPAAAETKRQLAKFFSFPKENTFAFPGETKETATKPVVSRGDVRIEMAALQAKRPEQLIHHEGYSLSYNNDYKIANWVAWELTREEAVSTKAARDGRFVPDPEVKGATALHEDYTRTGFDRGHLAPAGDMKWSAKAMRETFYLSNICPQHPKLNKGLWNTLENKCRAWANQHGTLWIATGPVITEDMRVMGKNRVGVPKQFYKVICYYSHNKYHGIAFLIENKDYGKTSLRTLAIPIDRVEKVTGIDFFYQLPESIQQDMEAVVDESFWF